MSAAEETFTLKLCETILSMGYRVAVDDGEESETYTDARQAAEHSLAVDMSNVYAINGEDESVASFLLVYGNASDASELPADTSSNPETDDILNNLSEAHPTWASLAS